jgi:nitrogenase molybdenum-iron protein alpha/beta subunit
LNVPKIIGDDVAQVIEQSNKQHKLIVCSVKTNHSASNGIHGDCGFGVVSVGLA